MNIALIGGGKASLVLIEQFSQFENYNITFICDVDPGAPGLRKARELGIPVCTDLTKIAEHPEIELVFEITGSSKVYEMLLDAVLPEQIVISSHTARLIFDMIDFHTVSTEQIRNKALSEEFTVLLEAFTSSLKPIDSSRRELENMFRKMNFININAKIEGAKVGKDANAFTAVIDEMANVMKQTSQTLTFLDEAVHNVKNSIDEVERARLKVLSQKADG